MGNYVIHGKLRDLDKTEDDPQLWNELAEKNKADISNEERKFVEETCQPEKINIEGPVSLLGSSEYPAACLSCSSC